MISAAPSFVQTSESVRHLQKCQATNLLTPECVLLCFPGNGSAVYQKLAIALASVFGEVPCTVVVRCQLVFFVSS